MQKPKSLLCFWALLYKHRFWQQQLRVQQALHVWKAWNILVLSKSAWTYLVLLQTFLNQNDWAASSQSQSQSTQQNTKEVRPTTVTNWNSSGSQNEHVTEDSSRSANRWNILNFFRVSTDNIFFSKLLLICVSVVQSLLLCWDIQSKGIQQSTDWALELWHCFCSHRCQMDRLQRGHHFP